MNLYGRVAIQAVGFISDSIEDEPRAAWTKAAERLCSSKHSARKVCPRSAFLGLCEEGHVRGVPEGQYVRRKGAQKYNKRYAVKAVGLLRDGVVSGDNGPQELSRLIQSTESKKTSHQGGMDVVLALWRNGLIGEAHNPR